ncbi:hypothetical protein ACPF8X_05625 [Streptomyces sp. G35A]
MLTQVSQGDRTEALFRVVHARTLGKSGRGRAPLAEAEHTPLPRTAMVAPPTAQ